MYVLCLFACYSFLSQLIQRDDTVHITFDIIYMNKRSPVLDILKQGLVLLNSWFFSFPTQIAEENKKKSTEGTN